MVCCGCGALTVDCGSGASCEACEGGMFCWFDEEFLVLVGADAGSSNAATREDHSPEYLLAWFDAV